jgi:serine/threonine-protein kinase/endoribonuclease IRE1
MTVFMFALKHLAADTTLAKYWPQGPDACTPFVAMFVHHNPLDRVSRTRVLALTSAAAQQQQQAQQAQAQAQQLSVARVGTPVKGSRPGADGAGAGASYLAVAAATASAASASADDASSVSSATEAGSQWGEPPGAGQPPPPPPPPRRQSEDASSGTTPTPPAAAAGGGGAAAAAAAAEGPGPIVVGYEVVQGDEQNLRAREFPSRPGAQACDFYQKTGHCRFGDLCIFDHPPHFAVLLTEQGLPYRPGEQLCSFYGKKGQCKFGPACKFHHPTLRPIYAGSGAMQVQEEEGGSWAE